MAHFAKLDENNTVLEVIVVNNDALDTSNEESSGITFLTEWSNGYSNWKQTSYNKSFRKNFASIGDLYDATLDAFIPPQPYPSWTLDTSTCGWVPPTPKPEDDTISYQWNEVAQKWVPLIVPPM